MGLLYLYMFRHHLHHLQGALHRNFIKDEEKYTLTVAARMLQYNTKYFSNCYILANDKAIPLHCILDVCFQRVLMSKGKSPA